MLAQGIVCTALNSTINSTVGRMTLRPMLVQSLALLGVNVWHIFFEVTAVTAIKIEIDFRIDFMSFLVSTSGSGGRLQSVLSE